MDIYSNVKLVLILFTVISAFANDNYYRLKIAKRIYNFKFKDKFMDMFSLYSLKEKVGLIE